jgi:hypothetical protein
MNDLEKLETAHMLGISPELLEQMPWLLPEEEDND